MVVEKVRKNYPCQYEEENIHVPPTKEEEVHVPPPMIKKEILASEKVKGHVNEMEEDT